MDSHFEEIFQGWLDKEQNNKNKGFLKKTKIWKKYFCVLRRYDGDDNVYFQWFEKEEDWRKEFPKGSFGLFPKYAVFKRKMEKVKHMFEISNDDETHYFSAENEKTMDLWVIQLMMQTRLNSSMIENSFRVKGGEQKCLQRIGAKNLSCLLHVSEYGITIALERTHSVLSQWPLTTIRNYECTDNNEFVFEAGRKSPMGEGKYHFHTTNSQDNDIFDQLDRYTSLRAKRVRSAGGRSRRDSDLEIAQAYGKLRWSVMLNKSTLNLGVIPGMSSAPQTIHQNDRPKQSRFDRNDSFQSTAVADSYDHLDRNGSLNERSSQQTDMSYSRLNCNNTQPERKGSQGSMRSPPFSDSYDHLERGSSFHGSPSSADNRSRSFGSLGRNRAQISSCTSPSQEDSYNHLSRYRHSSWSSSPKGLSNGHQSYDKLDRSTMSVQHGGTSVNSYDRLDSMQENVFPEQHRGKGPPGSLNNNEPNACDIFGNQRDHVPKPYDMVNIPKQQSSVEHPPPLPQKPSFMMQAEKETPKLPIKNSQNNRNTADKLNGGTEENNKTLETSDAPECDNGNETAASSHYQELDEVTEVEFETVDSRHRLNTHSSDTDLRKLSSEKSTTLDRSKRDTIHRSAPSLALYTIVRKKKSEKGSTKNLSKTVSTSKLDGFLKKIGRISKKGEKSEEVSERNYEKVSKKSRKSQQKLEKRAQPEDDSTASLRRLVSQDDDSNTYAEIDDNASSSRSTLRLVERSADSKRPLPELPPHSSMDV